VTLSPILREEFTRENPDNHYYAARMTSSTPLRVKTPAGEQQEKFLFYRGVSTFSVPISAKLTTAGKLLVENRSKEEIPNIILFERRGQKVGYRIGGAVRKDAILDPPELTGTIDDLGRDLEGMLVAQGLCQDEAHAMVEAWRHSWFEEGSRLLHIVPAAFREPCASLSGRAARNRYTRDGKGGAESVRHERQRNTENVRPIPGAHPGNHDPERIKSGQSPAVLPGSEFLLQFGSCAKCAQRLNSRSTMSARHAAAPIHDAAANRL